jgi:Fic family protein
LTIHPFYDGNGRTARILTNLILISFGFPPIYIESKEKDTYYRYLSEIQIYNANSDLFYSFMNTLLLRSLQVVLEIINNVVKEKT